MTSPNPTRAGFYPRVSRTGKRDRAALERHTLAQQRDLAVGFLPRTVELVEDERWLDVNVSGTHSNRPGLEALFADVESGKVDAVVVAYLSRFGRNARELLENVERLHAAGATFYSARENIVAPPGVNGTGKMLITILAAVAEMEADRLADGLADANARAIANGKSITVPYGYMRDNGPGSVLVFDERDDYGPSPASVVRRIFALRLEGVTSTAIAQLLNDEGVPTSSQYAEHRGRRVKQIGSRWTHRSVDVLLETHTYKGVIPRWQTEPTGKGKRRRRIPGTLELLPAEHDALIDEDTWRRAQYTRTTAVRTGRSTGSLLKGLVRCATCSRTMRPSSNGRALTYTCRGGSACDRPASIVRHAADEYVEAQLFGEGAPLADAIGVPVVDDVELDDLAAKISDAEDELEAFRSGGDAREPDYWPGVRERRARIDALERQRAELVREQAARPTPSPDVYATLSVDERREVLSDVLDAVVIRPAPGQGRAGAIERRVGAIIPFGQSPIELGRSGVPVAPRPFPLAEDD